MHFLEELVKRICFVYQSFFHQVIILLILRTFSLDNVLILLGEN